ncbi:hypothetical protein C8R44DRAFT_981833 [Mycena epipterygia]|nr:hypothetical protein C8R44DRAFT_981833 [Mycena epipterygia]
MSLKITFDACIADSIHVSVQRSRPRFDYHLHECGLEKLIKDASMQQKEEFRTVGELVLQASLARYIHQRWKPETPLCYHGAIRIRAMYVFVGAMLAALGYTYTLEWFLATFGLIIDGASAAYDIYQEDLELKLSMKSRSSDIERPSRKRPKLAHFAKVTAPFGKLNATPCGIGPFVNPPLPKVLDQIDILSIFGQPPADTLSISANTKTYPSLVPRFSLSGLRGQARDVIAGIAAFGRREVAAFQAAAFPEGTSIIPHFLQAFCQGFTSALTVDPGNTPSPTAPPSPTTPSSPVLHQSGAFP